MENKQIEYIKMCNCDEVQGQWKPKFMDMTNDGPVVDVGDGKSDVIITTIGEHGQMVVGFTEDCIWLPRQAQIQDMIGNKMLGQLIAGFAFYCMGNFETYELENKRKGITMEQLWLAFYMHDKHNKTWDGKKWK